jgi:hypothetical protein
MPRYTACPASGESARKDTMNADTVAVDASLSPKLVPVTNFDPMRAIRQNAWTLMGSGRCWVRSSERRSATGQGVGLKYFCASFQSS